MKMLAFRVCAFVFTTLTLCVAAKGTQLEILSTFDTDLEGWTKAPGGDPGTTVVWEAEGGNPGGHLRLNEAAAGAIDRIAAPAAFLGDKSAFIGGTFSMDRQTNTLANISVANDDIILIGGGLSLRINLPSPGVDTWITHTATLSADAGWVRVDNGQTPTAGEFAAVMADLTAIHLLGDFRSGPEVPRFDNIRMATGDASAGPPPAEAPVVWLRADEGLVLDDQGRVIRWEDRSGNNNHFEQPLGNKRPMPLADGMRVHLGDLYGFARTQTGASTSTRTLGNDFVVDEPIEVTHLAAFDNGGNGFTNTITVQIWTREDNSTPLTPEDDTEGAILEQITFTPEDPGTLEAPFRWKALETPRILAPGAYSIVAWGYTSDGYSTASSLPPSVPGVRWVGNSRHSGTNQPGVWPSTIRFAPDTYAGAMNLRYRPLSRTASIQPVVQFDGSDDGLIAPGTLNLQRPNTVLVVYERDTSSTGVLIQNASGTGWYIRNSGYYSGNWVRNFSFPWHARTLAAMTQTATQTRAYWNLSDVTHNADRPLGEPGRLAIGGGEGAINNPMAVRIAEVIAYDRVLPEAELREVKAYLAERYGIFDMPAATPGISPLGDFGTGDVTVTLEAATTGATIRYTTDGTDPTEASTLYTAPFTVARGTEVRARAFATGLLPSGVAATYYGAAATDELPVDGLLAWLRADRGVETDHEGGVQRWRDLTGNGNDFLQGTAFQRPTLVRSEAEGGGIGTQSFQRNGGTAILVRGSAGNQTYAGTLGADFVVTEPIEITDLGAFDHLGDGFGTPVVVQIWSRDNGGTPDTFNDDQPIDLLAEVVLTPEEPGVLNREFRFIELEAPLLLQPGDYSIIAWGFTGANFYRSTTDATWLRGEGVEFVGQSRFIAAAGAWPTTLQDHPVRYNGAGNFRFRRIGETPENRPSIRFDGEDDGLWAAATSNIPRPSTIYTVFERDTNGIILQNTSGGWWFLRNDGVYSTAWVVNRTFPFLDPQIVGVTNSLTETRAYVNSEEWTENPNVTPAAPGRLALGGGNGQSNNPGRSRVAEVLAFDRALDEGERWLVEDYLAARYTNRRPALPSVAITPPGDFGTGDVVVTLAHTVPGAEIRYTTDGSAPTAASPLYSSPLMLPRGTTVQARAFRGDATPSETASVFYGEATAPDNLPLAGATLWLRADQGIELDSAGGVLRWRDLSGQGNDMVQSIAEKRPIVTTTSSHGIVVPVTSVSGSTWAGSLGEDFIVDETISITHLGAYDHNRDGFGQTITVQLWSRDDGGTPATRAVHGPGELLAERTFTTADPGDLEGMMRFKPLDAPLDLPPGAYTIFAWGFTDGDNYWLSANESISGSDGRFRFIGDRSSASNAPGAWPNSLTSTGLRYNGAANFKYAPRPSTSGGTPVVTFDGVDDGLIGVESMNIGRPSTVVMSFRRDRNVSGFFIQNTDGGSWYIRNNGFYSNNWVTNETIPVRQPHLAAMFSGEGFTRAWLNGRDVTENANRPAPDPGRLALGGGEGQSINATAVSIGEVIAFDRILDESEMWILENYLTRRHNTYDLPVALPVITPPSGYGSGDVEVAITTATPGAAIRYTLDGTEPTAASPLYSGPFSVARDTTVRARAFLADTTPSPVASAFFGEETTRPLPVEVADAVLWLRSDIGVEADDLGRVRNWRDLSGNNHVFTPPTLDQAPLLVTDRFAPTRVVSATTAPGASGGTTYAGFIGTDFIVDEPIEITHLGAFDHLGDGFAGTITVRLHIVDDNGTPDNPADDFSGGILATQTFGPGAVGFLEGATRFIELDEPLLLQPGRYNLESSGWLGADSYSSGTNFPRTSGRGVTFPNLSRFGPSALFGASRLNDNRYARATPFIFRPVGATIETFPSVRFDGNNDGLAGPEDLLINRPSTVFAVFNVLGGTNGRLIQSMTSNWLLGPHTGSSSDGLFANAWAAQHTIERDSPSWIVGFLDTDQLRYFYNGVDLTEDPTPTGNLGRVALGGGVGWSNQPGNNELVELLIFDRALSPAERQQVGAYLADRYNLPREILLPPDVSPDGGLYASARTVSISHPIPGAEIRYTLDGSDPDESSPLYTAPLSITTDTLLKTRAYADGFLPGKIRESAFYFDATAPLPPSRDRLLLWLSATAGAETDETDAVHTWRDLSGSGRHATQAVTAQRPVLTPEAIGSAPALVFDGSNDHLVLPEGFADFSNGLTAIFVARTQTTGANQRILDLGRGQNSANIFFGRSASTTSAIYGSRENFTTRDLLAPNTYLSAANAIFTVTHNAAGEVKIFHNGSLISERSGVTIENIFRQSNFIGRSNWSAHAHFEGAIAEILLYDGLVDDFARETFEDALRARHGISTSATGSVAFSPSPANLYPSGVEVTLSSATEGARIHYTLDGSAPDEASALYTAPFFLGSSARVRARAFADDLNPSQFTEATYLVGQPPSSGDGLLGEYFNTVDLTGPSFTRVDPTIDFNWGSGSPDPSINTNLFSIRWTGKIMPRFTETYTFFSNSNDGMRLWIDLDGDGEFNDEEELILNWWVNQSHLTERVSGPVELVAGQLYNIRVEYYDNSGTAAIALRWQSFSEPKGIIPQSQLFSDAEFAQTVATPVITPPSGIYTQAVAVGITTATPSATIRYTTDGSEPTATSPVYTGSFEVGNDATIRARAFRSGFNPSGIATVSYIIDATPPLISSFAWEGEEIEDDDIFVRRGTFSAIATDDQGIHSAEFFYRPAGSPTRILVGRDTTPANGLTAAWNIAAVPDGEYEVTVRVFDNTGIWSEESRLITVALAVPGVPAITQPTSGITVQDPVVSVRVEAEAGTNVRLSRNDQFIFSGITNNNGVLLHTASLANGLNTFTAVTRNRAGDSAPSNAVEVTRVREFPQLVMTFDGTAVGEALPVNGTITIPAPEPADLVVQLSTNRSNRFDNIAPVVIPAGQTSRTFTLEARDDNIIQAPTTVQVTAAANEYRSAVVQLDLLDNDAPILGLTLAESSVSEDHGLVTATLTRSPISGRSVTVALRNTHPGRVTVPSTVTFSGGAGTVTFNVSVIDNDVVDGNALVGLSGEVSVGGFIVATSNTATLEVRDNDGAVLTLETTRPALSEGGAGATATLRRVGTGTGSPLTVAISSNPGGQLTHPSSVTIPAGSNQATFAVSAPVNASVNGTRTVSLRATAEGFTDALRPLTVTDQALPDLAVSQPFIAATARTEEYTAVSYRVDNVGFAPAVGPFLERIFFSPTPTLGSDALLVRQIQQTGEVEPGGFYFRDLTVLTPRPTGTYYLIVVVDAANQVAELTTGNNTAVRLSPIEIRAAYGATVTASPGILPANTPVTFSGSVTNEAGQPAAFAMINIHIGLGSTNRVISAIANSAGQYSVEWMPLTNEGGLYTVGATHPGNTTAEVQDSFEILTLQVTAPTAQIRLNEGETGISQITLTNPNDRPLTDLEIAFLSVPPGLTISAPVPDGGSLAAGQSVVVPLSVQTDPGFSGTGTFPIVVTSAEGLEIRGRNLRLRSDLLRPSLSVDPSSLNVSALRGAVRSHTLTLTNTGTLATGPIQVALPDVPWFTLASANPLPSIPPGESAPVSFNVAPGEDVPLTLFNGSFGLNPANGGGRSVNYRIRTVSDLVGDLQIEVVNEFFFFTEEAPKLEGATVTVRDAISSELIASMDTGVDGLATFPNLNEGWYRIDVNAPEHDRFTGNFYVNAGETNFRQIFISRRMVRYSFTVEEIEIEDIYRVTIETVFETNVPVPVVTATPSRIDLASLTELGQQMTVNVRLDNHGWIDAQNSEFEFSDHPFYDFRPLITQVGTIPAKSSLIVPVTITRIGMFAGDGSIIILDGFGGNNVPPAEGYGMLASGDFYTVHSGGGVPCGGGGRVNYDYECADNIITRFAALVFSNVSGNCGGGSGPGSSGGGFVGGFYGGSGGGGGGGFGGRGGSVSLSEPDLCCISDAAFDCLISLVPGLGCANAIYKCARGGASACASVPFSCLKSLSGPYANAFFCLAGFAECAFGGGPGGGPGGGGGGFFGLSTLGFGSNSSHSGGFDGTYIPAYFRTLDDRLNVALDRAEIFFQYMEYIFGGPEMVFYFAYDEMTVWTEAFDAAVEESSPGGSLITEGERELLLALAVERLDPVVIGNFLDRWNRTETYYAAGIFEIEQVPAGESTDFIDQEGLITVTETWLGAIEDSQAEGFEDPFEQLNTVFREARADFSRDNSGVCARVRIELSQDVVMTRTAFLATLELENERVDALQNVRFDFRIRDEDGVPAEDLFNIQVTRLTGISAIDGTSSIGARATGIAQWTLIPRDTSVQETDRVYTIGGTIRYTQDGTEFTIPVQNVPITVRPDASLALRYYHQRDVISNDPFTDVIEPAQPYKLAVVVQNNGFGEARNLRIISGQPQIVENERGLFIDFQIIGTEVEGQNLTPSLTADFGNLAPGTSKVAVWSMTSTLQGLFIDYSATFEHVTGLGDPRLSLMESVEIFEMIRLIRNINQAPGTAYAFLTNDIPDPNDFPDTVHFRDGTTEAVTLIQTGTFSGPPATGNLSVTLQTAPFAGWAYIRLPDPGEGLFRLVSVTRADGRVLPLDENAWLSDRTFIGMGERPVYENILHLVDADSSGTYTLEFEPLDEAPAEPPSSAVAALPAVSPQEFPVFWTSTGSNRADTFDIYVSVDGEPFSLWRSATRDTGGLYIGTFGSSYSFYSIARDRFGTLEEKPAVAEATTNVGNPNLPPVIAPIADRIIPAGSVLSVQASATDPDGDNNNIRYTIGTNRPGVTINPITGLITWTTGLTDANTTATIVVIATDGGTPAASAQTTFQVTVQGVNRPPVIDPVGPQTLQQGGLLIVDVDATDLDIPTQTLTYSFDVAPAGAVIHPATGVIQWSPTPAQAGQAHPFTVRVTDNGTPPASATMSFSVNVVAPPDDEPPFFTGLPVVLWLKGQTHTLTVFATNPAGPSLSLSANLTGVTGAVFNDQGDGSANLQWDPTDAESGIYAVPVTATANGLSVNGTVRIRVEDENLYWNWVQDTFGQSFPQDFDLTLLDKDADPDGDGRPNVHEMALLTDPLGNDSVPVRLEVARSGNFQLVNLRFDRRTGSQNFVDFRVRRATSLEGPWEVVPSSQISAYVNRRGNEDGRPETQTVDYDVLELHPGGIPDRSFYRIETIQKMNEE